jgi:thioredoxin reductase/ferredoxin
MTLIVPAVLGGVALSVMALVSIAAGRKRKRQPATLRVDVPRILVHDINDDRCTGCDACVAVCPTNVLDLVENKSRVINFGDCIQCEACMWACPTEALVMHPEGTEPPTIKMPELDQYYQTAVPGQYLIGEVAGKPLIKNAANLGRGVVEHMIHNGLRPGALARSGSFAEGSDAANVTCVDVAIVGSGPGGLSAALTCIQRGLSYVLLEKDQTISSTIAHYPKGKLVMAEPYDVPNLSLLPVFDSSKEQILPIWRDMVSALGMNVKLGEAVEGVTRQGDGVFDVRTNVSSYRAQRVVLATGTRGKPRTLGVPGENLPKVNSLLDDPDDFRGLPVLVVGGGDSAVEAALALADAGAKVVVSYRGRAFQRAQPKNKAAIESYAAQRRIKVKFQSVVEQFDDQTVTLVMQDGTRKKYPNAAAFVLIGADPPVRWLAKLGIEFVERPHQFKLSKSEEMVQKFVPNALPCPETAAAACAALRGEPVPMAERPAPTPDAVPVSGPRRWLRSATNIFTSAGRRGDSRLESRAEAQERALDNGPVPLSEFARRGRKHTGRGRRDELDARERTRVLRMLRDEGGRIADEESQVYRVESRSEVVFDSPPPGFMQDSPQPRPRPRPRPAAPQEPLSADDSAPKRAVIVGLARAMAEGPQSAPRRKRRSSPPPPPVPRRKRPSQAPEFLEEPTVQVDSSKGIAAMISSQPARGDFSDEATRNVDFDAAQMMMQAEEMTELTSSDVIVSEDATGAIHIDTGAYGKLEPFDDNSDESTRAVDLSDVARLDQISAREVARGTTHDEATRAINIGRGRDPRRRPPVPKRAASLSDVDWDLD